MCNAAKNIAKLGASIAMPAPRALQRRSPGIASSAGNAATNVVASFVTKTLHNLACSSTAHAEVVIPFITVLVVAHPFLENDHLNASRANQLLRCGAENAI